MNQKDFEKWACKYLGVGINLYDKLPGEDGQKFFTEEVFKSFGDIDLEILGNQSSLFGLELKSKDSKTSTCISFEGDRLSVSLFKYNTEKGEAFYDTKEAFAEQKVFKVDAKKENIKDYTEFSADVTAPGVSMNSMLVILRSSGMSYDEVVSKLLYGDNFIRNRIEGVQITQDGEVKIVNNSGRIKVAEADIIESVFNGNEDEYFNNLENLAEKILERSKREDKPIRDCLDDLLNSEKGEMGDN